MVAQPGLCRTWSEPRRLVFSQWDSFWSQWVTLGPMLLHFSCSNSILFGIYLSRVMRKPTFWFPTWSDTNQAVKLQKMARGLKFRIQKVEGLFYLCGENKGADQLRGYREADLPLCFRICKTLVFSWYGSFSNVSVCLMYCFTSTVNSWDHVMTVSYPNHTVSWQVSLRQLRRQFTSTMWTFFGH